MRALIFNQYALLRTHSDLLIGDVVGLQSSQSFFSVTSNNLKDCQDRMNKKELVLAGPLFGKEQKLQLSGEPNNCLQSVLSEHVLFKYFLEKNTSMSYRVMRIYPINMKWEFKQDKTLMLKFCLPKGSYATTLIENLDDV